MNWEEKSLEWKREDFEKKKRGCISYIKEIQNLKNWENCIDRRSWESFLTLDFFKNWEDKIINLEKEEDLFFFSSRISGLIKFIYFSTIKEKNNHIDALRLIQQEEKRLKNISKEEWKEDKLNPLRNKYFEITELNIEEIFSPKTLNINVDSEIPKKNPTTWKNYLPSGIFGSLSLLSFLLFLR